MNVQFIPMLPVLLETVIKITLLLLVSWGCILMLRNASAATRHLIWTIALSGALLLPLLSLCLPQWNIIWENTKSASAVAVLYPINRVQPKSARASTPDPTLAPADTTQYTIVKPHKAAETLALVGISFWFLGFLVVLAQLLIGIRRVGAAKHRASPLDQKTLRLVKTVLQGFSVRRAVDFRCETETNDVPIPITWGAFRPVVLLPVQAKTWSEDCLRAALLHELAHIQRGDWITQTATRFICALYWWHPLIWFAARQAREESERACDDLVLGTGMKATDYAQRLVEVVRAMPAGASKNTTAIAMAQPSEVEGRVRAILARGKQRRPITRRLWTSIALLFGVGLFPLAALRLQAQAERSSSPAGDSQATTDSTPASVPQASDIPMASGNIISSNGVTVSLDGVAVLTAPSGYEYWWDTEGIPLTAMLFPWPSTAPFPLNPSPEQKTWGIAIGVANPTAENALVRWQVLNTTSGAPVPTLGEQVADLSHGRVYYAVTALLPNSATDCTVRVGLAAGGWEQSAVWHPNNRNTISQGVTWNVSTDTASQGSEFALRPFQVAVRLRDKLTQRDQRIVAVDANGNVIEGMQFAPTARDNCQVLATFNLPLTQVREFRLQTRPFVWRQFRPVLLHLHTAVNGKDIRVAMRSLDQTNDYFGKRFIQINSESRRLRLPNAERIKRNDAFYKAFAAENARVSAANYMVPFDPSVVERAEQAVVDGQ